MSTKQQVVALAEKHNITVSFRYTPYNQWCSSDSARWSNYECYLDVPVGYWICSQGLHCRLISYPQITNAQAKKGQGKLYLAKHFWNDVMEVLEECIEYNGKCECRDCVEQLKELHQQHLSDMYKVNREAVEK